MTNLTLWTPEKRMIFKRNKRYGPSTMPHELAERQAHRQF